MTENKNLKKTKLAVIIFLVIAIIITALTTVLSFGESKSGYKTITVIEVTGTVGVVHNDTEYQAYTGMHLEEGYSVVTSGNSYIRLLLDDDKYVKLEAGSKATFEEAYGGKTAIRVERGSIVAEVTRPLEIDEDFIVNTPNAVLAVRGTLFRVDLSRNEKGELNTDVMTYGGAVTSKRVQPNGEVEALELTIKQGFKATVNMDDEKTVYLVDDIKVDLSDLVGTENSDTTITETNVDGTIINTPITLESILKPIVIEDIPDEDLVDIYFASENGHEMFVETEELSEQIEKREIDITAQTSVYEKAEKIENPVEIAIPDDNVPLVTTTEGVTEPAIMVQGPPTDGLGETTTETIPETTTASVTTEPTTVPITESTTKPIVSNTEPTTTPIVSATEPTTEETTVHTHNEVTEEVKPTCTKTGKLTVKCSECGEILSEKVLEKLGHTTETTTIDATCTKDGKKTEKCTVCGEVVSETVIEKLGHTTETTTVNSTCTEDGKKTEKCTVCGEVISETVIASTGHKSIYSGAKDAHTECEVCHEILSASHTYTTNTVAATCTQDGGTNYICECGYNYTDIIPKTGHTEINAGEPDVHTKCDVCGEALTDGTSHSYTDTETKSATCTTVGELTHTCPCGWSYTEEIPAGHKKSDDGTTCSGCGKIWVDLNSTNFPDSMLLSYLSTTYDADGNNALIGDEVTGVVTINVSGDSQTDGGYTDLTGVNKFTNLTTLNCAYNSSITELDLSGLSNLTSLDITGLTSLKALDISGTALSEADITGFESCTSLEALNASGCVNIVDLNANNYLYLKTVSLSNCTSLESFVIDDNSNSYAISSIALDGCTSLKELTINNGSGLTTIDLSDAAALETLDLGGCQGITGTLDLSGKSNLSSVTIGSLNKLTTLNVNGCTSLTALTTTACTSLTTLIGASSCTNLTTLTLVNSGFTSLDLQSNDKLEKLNVMNCKSLTYLDLTRSSESTVFNSLTVTNCTALKTLNLYNCKGITSLVTSTLTALEELNLSYSGVTTFNSVTDTMSFSPNTNLKNVYLNGVTSFTGFDVSGNTALEEFSLTENSNASTLDFSACTNLKNLTLSDVTALTTLNIDNCTALESLNVMNTGVNSLSVTGSSALTQVYVYNNNSLATLNITGASSLANVKLSAGTTNTALKNLSVTNSGLTSLDVTYLTGITTLDLSNTAITALDLSPCTNIASVNVTGNNMSSGSVTLPDGKDESIITGLV